MWKNFESKFSLMTWLRSLSVHGGDTHHIRWSIPSYLNLFDFQKWWLNMFWKCWADFIFVENWETQNGSDRRRGRVSAREWEDTSVGWQRSRRGTSTGTQLQSKTQKKTQEVNLGLSSDHLLIHKTSYVYDQASCTVLLPHHIMVNPLHYSLIDIDYIPCSFPRLCERWFFYK